MSNARVQALPLESPFGPLDESSNPSPHRVGDMYLGIDYWSWHQLEEDTLYVLENGRVVSGKSHRLEVYWYRSPEEYDRVILPLSWVWV
jgi:hypothetical protein